MCGFGYVDVKLNDEVQQASLVVLGLWLHPSPTAQRIQLMVFEHSVGLGDFAYEDEIE